MKDYQSPPNIKAALTIGFIWSLMAILQSIYEYTIVTNYDANTENFNLSALIQSSSITVFIAGVLAGLFLLPRVQKWLRLHSYGKALVYCIVLITIMYLITSFLSSFIYNSVYSKKSVDSPAVLAKVFEYMVGMENLKNYAFWLLVILATVIGLEINDKYGPGNFRRFLSGRYFHPQEEYRIFMFLDIKSATSIAENLSELEYFSFLKDFFSDITPAILATEADVYQYVGDEIVISWTLEKKSNRCLDAFFRIKTLIKSKASKYNDRYGIVPQFKAGIHAGKVIAGEIGIIKRDISFSGDVLNTASRIQSQCNSLGEELLLSTEVLQHLNVASSEYTVKSVAAVDLKGKAKPLELVTIARAGD